VEWLVRHAQSFALLACPKVQAAGQLAGTNSRVCCVYCSICGTAVYSIKQLVHHLLVTWVSGVHQMVFMVPQLLSNLKAAVCPDMAGACHSVCVYLLETGFGWYNTGRCCQLCLDRLACSTASTMQLPTLQSQQALTSQQRHSSYLQSPQTRHRAARRQLVIAAGEARSANRTKWTQKDVQQTQQGWDSSQKKQQVNSNIMQLTQLDDAHDLVGMLWQQ
jgi:hypothetical protein